MSAQAFLERAQALADEAQQELNELQARRAKIDEDIRKIRAFVRAITPPEPKPKSAKTSAKSKSRSVSPERLLTVAEAILAMPDADFVARELRAQPSVESVPEGGVYAALESLRTIGFLRMTGRRKNGRGRHVDHYRVMDRDVLSELKAAANG